MNCCRVNRFEQLAQSKTFHGLLNIYVHAHTPIPEEFGEIFGKRSNLPAAEPECPSPNKAEAPGELSLKLPRKRSVLCFFFFFFPILIFFFLKRKSRWLLCGTALGWGKGVWVGGGRGAGLARGSRGAGACAGLARGLRCAGVCV